MTDPAPLLQHFRDELRNDPVRAYRDWFRAQEELRDRGAANAACALADDLWELLPSLPFDTSGERARFLHNAAVFYGSPGPAADIARARRLFTEALEVFVTEDDGDWKARALHNHATALSNLGTSAADLEESVCLFERALEWRTSEREIARAVSLHNLGLALRRLAELDPPRTPDHLTASAGALREAVEIRSRLGLDEGRALSARYLQLTIERMKEEAG